MLGRSEDEEAGYLRQDICQLSVSVIIPLDILLSAHRSLR